MHRYTHWVFDLDGTLTVHQHDFDAIRHSLGIPAGQLILEYLEELDQATATRLRAQLDQLEQELVEEVEVAAGALETIAHLNARGAQLGILTRNTRQNALTTLARTGLDRWFNPEFVLGRETAAPKPSPQGIHQLLTRWHAALDDSVMVGDFRLDLEAGRNAGIATTHVAGHDAERWPDLTDHHFPSMVELLAALEAAPR